MCSGTQCLYSSKARTLMLSVLQESSLSELEPGQFELGSYELMPVAADADDAGVCEYDQQG